MRKICLSICAFVFLSCSFVFAKTANEWVAEGDKYLEVHDTVNAYRCYSEAYKIDPNNQDANFGLAMLNLPHFLIDGGDSDVNNFLLENGICVIGDVYDLIVSNKKVEQNSTIPQMQDFIESHILPYVTQTLGYFNKITPSFQKTIKKEMQSYDAWKDAEIVTRKDEESGEWYISCHIMEYQSGKLVESTFWDKTEFLILPPKVEVGMWWKPEEMWWKPEVAIWWHPYDYEEDIISEVESVSETVTTPAGTFTNCVKITTIYPPNKYYPNEYKEIYYYKQNVGWVKTVLMENSNVIKTCELVSCSVTGSGYWPLEEGNQWDYQVSSEEGQSSFSYRVSSVSTHQEIENKECDYSDILAAKGVMNLVKGVLDIGCAYNLDVDPDDTKDKNLKDILDEYPNLFKIKDQTKMNDALTCFQNFFDCLINSYDSINNEKDNQDDDLLVFPKDDEEFNYFKDDIRNLLSDLRELLNPSGKSFDITDLILKMNYYKSDAPIKFPKKINLSKFFTNPITRTNITQLDFDENGKVIFSSLWNVDQTLNGVFPDISQKEFIGYFNGGLHLDVEIAGENSNYLYGEICGEDIDFKKDISNVKIYRNTTPSVDESSTLIATISPKDPNFEVRGDDAFFKITDYNASGDTYYYRAIVNYKDSSYSMSSAERVAKKLYVNKNATGIYKGTSDKPYKYIGIANEYGNPGSTIYISGGTYNLEEDPEIKRYIGIQVDNIGIQVDNGMKFIGSCNPNTWVSDLNYYPTIIDATDKWVGFFIDYYTNNVSIENFIIKNSEGNGIFIRGSNNTIKNCLIYNCNNTGIDVWTWKRPGNSIINCTLVNNYNGIESGGCDIIKNTIIAENENYGVYFDEGSPDFYEGSPDFSYNNVWKNGENYFGIPDQTGINGNISIDPLFVDPENGNYRLSENSPCIGAGEGGVDMGAYPYVEFTEKKGDINGDTEIDISDVILCLRMALGLSVTIQGETYTSYSDSLVNCANINSDNSIDISDVILVLRMALGLPITINGHTYNFPYDNL